LRESSNGVEWPHNCGTVAQCHGSLDPWPHSLVHLCPPPLRPPTAHLAPTPQRPADAVPTPLKAGLPPTRSPERAVILIGHSCRRAPPSRTFSPSYSHSCNIAPSALLRFRHADPSCPRAIAQTRSTPLSVASPRYPDELPRRLGSLAPAPVVLVAPSRGRAGNKRQLPARNLRKARRDCRPGLALPNNSGLSLINYPRPSLIFPFHALLPAMHLAAEPLRLPRKSHYARSQ
jgi:hypothetical protein